MADRWQRRLARPMRATRNEAAAGFIRSRQQEPQRVPARLRPHHPLHRLPPPQAQDPGLRVRRRRPLPHPAHPHARSGADRARARPRAAASTRIWPRRWRSPTISAIRRSAMPASARSTPASRAFGGFDHNAQTLRVVTALERRYPELRRAEPDLGNAGRPGQAQRPADRPRRNAARPLSRARRARDDPGLCRAAGSATVELRRRWRRKSRRSPTTSPTTLTTSTTACAPSCSALDDIAAVPLPGTIIGEIARAYPGARCSSPRCTNSSAG